MENFEEIKRTAIFDKGTKILTFFTSRHATESASCRDITHAKKIMINRTSIVHEKIDMYNMGLFSKTLFI